MKPISKASFIKGNLETRIVKGGAKDFCAILFGGSMETLFIDDDEMQNTIKKTCFDQKYNYVIDLEEVNHISSRGISQLICLTNNVKKWFLISPFQKNIQSLKSLEYIDAFDLQKNSYNTLDDLSKKKIPKELIKILTEEKKHLKEITRQYKRYLEIKTDEHYYIKIIRDYKDKNRITAVKEIESLRANLKNTGMINYYAEPMYSAATYTVLNTGLKAIKNKTNRERIELLAKEITNNSFEHGYKKQDGGVMIASYENNGRKVIFTFADFGVGGEIKEENEGRGIKILRGFFDSVKFRESPKAMKNNYKELGYKTLGDGTQIELIKYR